MAITIVSVKFDIVTAVNTYILKNTDLYVLPKL